SDCSLAYPQFARLGVPDLNRLKLEYFRPAGLVDDDCFRHYACLRWWLPVGPACMPRVGAFASLSNLSNIRTVIEDAYCVCAVGPLHLRAPLRAPTRHADL